MSRWLFPRDWRGGLRDRQTEDAALQKSRLRLRTILMISRAFLMGMVPLVVSTRAKAKLRRGER